MPRPTLDPGPTPRYTIRRPGHVAWETGVVGIEAAWASQAEANRCSAPGHEIVREDPDEDE